MQAMSIFLRFVCDGWVYHLIQGLINLVVVNQVCWDLLIAILMNKINASHPSSYSFNYGCESLKAVAILALKSEWATDFCCDCLDEDSWWLHLITHIILKNTMWCHSKSLNPDFGNLVWVCRWSCSGSWYILKHAMSSQVRQFIW